MAKKIVTRGKIVVGRNKVNGTSVTSGLVPIKVGIGDGDV